MNMETQAQYNNEDDNDDTRQTNGQPYFSCPTQ